MILLSLLAFASAQTPCSTGTEFDLVASKCVPVSCAANPCGAGATCVPNNNVCIRAPCPQFTCVDAPVDVCSQAGSDERKCLSINSQQCSFFWDLKSNVGKCSPPCVVLCATPDLAAYARENKCEFGAVMTGCCTAGCRPRPTTTTTTTIAPTPTCAAGTEFDELAKKCVAVSCDANPCASGERCVPSDNVCVRAPCPQFSCQSCAGADEKTCAALNYPCVYQFDLSTGSAKCDACYVRCAAPDLAAYARENKCEFGAVMTGCCTAGCRPRPTTIAPTPTCAAGTEFDELAKKCVAVSCDANPCASGERCVPSDNVCVRAPCPQFSCQSCAGADEKTCAALNYPCVYQFDLSTGSAKCDACYVRCAAPDLAAYARENKCEFGAVMTGCCSAGCRPRPTTTTVAPSPCLGADERKCKALGSPCVFQVDVTSGRGSCEACYVRCATPDLSAFAAENRCENGAVMTSCCGAACRPRASCALGTEFDAVANKCVAVSCAANPCLANELCVETKIACAKAPCAQFMCQARDPCAAIATPDKCASNGCSWIHNFDTKPIVGACRQCLVECISPDLATFAKENRCTNGAVLSSCCAAQCAPLATVDTTLGSTKPTTATTTKTPCVADDVACKPLPRICQPLGTTSSGCKTCAARCQFVIEVRGKSDGDVANAAKLVGQGLSVAVSKSGDKFLLDVSGQVGDESAAASVASLVRDTIAGAANIESAAVVELAVTDATSTRDSGAASASLAVAALVAAAAAALMRC